MDRTNKKKICVLMFYDDKISCYGDINLKINKKYCEKYNFDIIHSKEKSYASRHPSFEKLPLIIKHIQNYDYIIWIDADAYFYLDSKNISEFIDKYETYDFIFSGDVNVTTDEEINAGFFIVKNTEYSLKFLNEWAFNEDLYQFAPVLQPGWWIEGLEQGLFRYMYRNNILEIKSRCITIPYGHLQHFYTDDKIHSPFVHHIAGRDTDVRIQASLDYYSKIKDISLINKRDNNKQDNNLHIMSIFKNETMNLKMWLEHYIWQGVEHFYLIDNGSTDNPLEILQYYIDNGIVTYYYRPEKHQQVQHYRYIFDKENLKEKTQWLCICDLDEFFFGVEDILINSIKAFNDYDVVYTNSFFYGSDNLVDHPKDIRTAIIYREEYRENYGTKYIFKPKSINNSSEIWIHWLVESGTLNKKQMNEINQNNKIRLNNYRIQSFEYYKNVKMTRGDNSSINSENIRDFDYFINYTKLATIKDDILKQLVETGYTTAETEMNIDDQYLPEKLCFDIGANIGDWSLKNINKYEKIIAIEASETTFNNLKNRISNIDIILPLNYAVCDSSKEFIDFYHCENNSLSSINEKWLTGGKSRFNHKYIKTISKTISIDKLIEIYGIPDLIKVDVETCEYECIKSMTNKYKDICFEFASEYLENTYNCLNYLYQLGYRNFFIQLNSDEYSFRPSSYYNIITAKNILARTIPKRDWGMIWSK